MAGTAGAAADWVGAGEDADDRRADRRGQVQRAGVVADGRGRSGAGTRRAAAASCGRRGSRTSRRARSGGSDVRLPRRSRLRRGRRRSPPSPPVARYAFTASRANLAGGPAFRLPAGAGARGPASAGFVRGTARRANAASAAETATGAARVRSPQPSSSATRQYRAWAGIARPVSGISRWQARCEPSRALSSPMRTGAPVAAVIRPVRANPCRSRTTSNRAARRSHSSVFQEERPPRRSNGIARSTSGCGSTRSRKPDAITQLISARGEPPPEHGQQGHRLHHVHPARWA